MGERRKASADGRRYTQMIGKGAGGWLSGRLASCISRLTRRGEIMTIIAAMDKNRVIGRDNKMPWHISEETKHFRRTTTGHVLLVGRKTYQSWGGKPLPNRHACNRKPNHARHKRCGCVQIARSSHRKSQILWPQSIHLRRRRNISRHAIKS